MKIGAACHRWRAFGNSVNGCNPRAIAHIPQGDTHPAGNNGGFAAPLRPSIAPDVMLAWADGKVGLPTETVRVLIAAPFGTGGRGGIDRVMDALADEVRVRGEPAAVEIVATRGGGSLAFAPLHLARFVATLAARRMRGSVDLVHLNVAQRGSVVRKAMIGRIAHAFGIPYIVHVHGSQFHTYWDASGPRARRRLRRLLEQSKAVVVLGTFWRDALIRTGTDAAKLRIIPNASAAPTTPPAFRSGDPIHFVFLGRIGERKGVPTLLQALALLGDLDGWRATIAGDGAVEEARARVAELNLAERVEVRGWADAAAVAALLASGDCLVLPSHDENLPMSVIEGMAYGLAVVATPVGAVPDIVSEGETGLLVPPGDPDALAAALRRIVTEPGLRGYLGATARRFHAERLDLAGYARRMTALWHEAAGRPG